MKEKIVEELYNKLVSTYKVNFIPFDKFEEDLEVVSHDFLLNLKPIEKEYNRIKKSKDAHKIMVSKAEYVRDRFYMNPLLLTSFKLPSVSLKHPKDKRGISFTSQQLEEYILEELKKYTDDQLKEHFDVSYKKLEKEYDESVKKRDEFMFNSLMHYAQKKNPALFKSNDFNQNGNSQKIETVEQLFKEYISRLAIPTYRILVGKGKVGSLSVKGAMPIGNGITSNKILFLDTPENIIKNFRVTYLDDYGKYQELFRNAQSYINKEQNNFLITDYEINVGSISFSSEKGRLSNAYKITRGSKSPYEYIETNNVEKVESDIINIFLLTLKGDLIKLCIYDKGLLNRNEYFIKEIKQVEQVHNSIVRVSPIKHFNPATIVFDSPENASKFASKINGFRKKGNIERN